MASPISITLSDGNQYPPLQVEHTFERVLDNLNRRNQGDKVVDALIVYQSKTSKPSLAGFIA